MTTVMLECDRCRAPRQARHGWTIEDLRQVLREVGWKCPPPTDVDLCPACREQP